MQILSNESNLNGMQIFMGLNLRMFGVWLLNFSRESVCDIWWITS